MEFIQCKYYAQEKEEDNGVVGKFFVPRGGKKEKHYRRSSGLVNWNGLSLGEKPLVGAVR
jgi:hypothetical protein